VGLEHWRHVTRGVEGERDDVGGFVTEKLQPLEGDKAQKKVAIVGFAESWKLAPWDDQSVEAWCLNEFWKYAPRWSRWFEVHDEETLGVTKRDLSEGEQKRHLEWLSKDHGPNKPIYMQKQFCDGRFPNAVPLPIEHLCTLFRAGRYFTSSIAMMVAMAIDEGYTWIGLYGIDLANDREYPYERPNAEYIIGIAEGRGIHIEIAPTSAILKAGHLYAFEKPMGDNRMLTAVKNHLDGLKKKRDETVALMQTLDGAVQECENFIKLPEFMERGVHLTGY
jgi:hypothetical protein